MAFLSPEPVTMYLSSDEISQLRTEDDSLDCKKKEKNYKDLKLHIMYQNTSSFFSDQIEPKIWYFKPEILLDKWNQINTMYKNVLLNKFFVSGGFKNGK